MDNSSSHVESRWRTQLRNRIIQASSLLEILLSGLVLIGLLLSAVPLIKWMPGLLFDGNEVEIRIFLERSLDIVIGIEFIKMLAKHSPGSSLEVLLYAIARHLVVGHDSAVVPGKQGRNPTRRGVSFMSKTIIPANYTPALNLYDTQHITP